MKYFILLIISFFSFFINSNAAKSEFYDIGSFSVTESVTSRDSVKHTIYFARTEGKQYCFSIKNNENVFGGGNEFNNKNQFTTVTVNPKQVYQLYENALRAKYLVSKFFIRFKKYLYFTYGANNGGSLGIAIEPHKLRTRAIFILNSQEYYFNSTDFNSFVRIIKPVAEAYGPISVIHQLPILGHLK